MVKLLVSHSLVEIESLKNRLEQAGNALGQAVRDLYQTGRPLAVSCDGRDRRRMQEMHERLLQIRVGEAEGCLA